MKRRLVLVAVMLFITFTAGWVVLPSFGIDRAMEHSAEQ